MENPLLALSPLDGRYQAQAMPLREWFSEFAYFRLRLRVEIAYLLFLNERLGRPRPLLDGERRQLEQIAESFSLADALRVQELERQTRHDVKALELFIRERLEAVGLSELIPWVHFGLTSEDVNSTAQALALAGSREKVLLPHLDLLLSRLADLARTCAAMPMPARTHGQIAVPTTFGKEIAVFLARLRPLRQALARHVFQAHWSGAVGNYNAVVAAFPEFDWVTFSRHFLASLNLEAHPCTTQILPYENWLEYFSHLQRLNGVLLDLVQDLWRYLSDGYLGLEVVRTEIGSSTMPQKVNPIDFENAEGNLGLANALIEHYQRKLPISRLQRDLSDSTVRRTFGVALGHTLVAWQAILRGLERLQVYPQVMGRALEEHWEVVAEGAQTLLRAAGYAAAYDWLKALTRGRSLTREAYLEWVESLPVDPPLKERLRALSPQEFLGLSPWLARSIADEVPG
uniref:Adenylosuccinate lyase n=1 Tax=uncultured Chloroflexota bacterium TaxID=166587 RepID=H5SCY0_9CHLR|nr:adenylosuccinate lyase [uncultured Chloroflexota bacterium]